MCALLVAFAAACGGGGGGGGDDDGSNIDAAGGGGDGGGGGNVILPPVNGSVDYQLGGAYPPPAGVTVVSRDRTAERAQGIYNICYVNGFQIQPDEEQFWMTQHPDLILRNAQGQPVIDTDWNEMLVDVSTAAKRTAVAAIMDEWIAGCGVGGYAAIEIDNLDSYSRSQGLLTEDNNVAAMALFAASAHARDLAIAQKNSAEIVTRKAEMATDFAVAEECNQFNECGVYTDGYGDHVIVIEYQRTPFDAGCTEYPNLSMVLRDRNLVTQGATGYVYDGC
jgi:hypothetical protein